MITKNYQTRIMDALCKVSDVVYKNLDENPSKTLIYLSIGSAEVSTFNNGGDGYDDQNIDATRASSQQLPPFIRRYIEQYPTHKIIAIIIDQLFNIKPRIIPEGYVKTSIEKNTKLYTSELPLTIITIEKAVRWALPRHECEKNVLDIRDFVKDIAIKCMNTKSCIIMESFTGDSLYELRQFIDIKCCDYIDELLDHCMIGLTVKGDYCHPELNSKEYDINIHYTKENGIFINNPHTIIKYPLKFKKIFLKSIDTDYSLAIRLSKLLNLKAEVICDSILTLARMSVSLNNDITSVNDKVYVDNICFTSETFCVNIIDDINWIFDFLEKKCEELFTYSFCKDSVKEQLVILINKFRYSKNPYSDFSHIKKRVMDIFQEVI
jgi:hypothetical protein